MTGKRSREANSTLVASSRMGARNDGMRNICELLINVVIARQAKDADRPGPKGKGYGWGSSVLSHTIYDSPGEQADANPLCKFGGTG